MPKPTGMVDQLPNHHTADAALQHQSDQHLGLNHHQHLTTLPAPAHPVSDVESGSPHTTEESSHDDVDEHVHYSHRAPWLRAFVLGANDGLVSTASLMLGVGAGAEGLHAMQLAGVAGLVAGALSMAAGEYISVSSQKDAEEADIEKERQEQLKGPIAQHREFEELVRIYANRGLSEPLARAVAQELTDKDVVRAHARDELGIDLDELSNPLQASWTSAVAFSLGAGLPLLAGAFIHNWRWRIASVCMVSAAALVVLGSLSAALGGAKVGKGAMRVLVGGCIAMAVTYGIGSAFAAVAGPAFKMSA